MANSPDERNALARLDLAIIELEKEQREAIELKTLISDHARRVGEIKAEFMGIRDAMQPLLDSSAPKEF